MPGCEIHDDPLAPICAACRARVAKEGDRAGNRLASSRGAIRREARHARRDDCRHGRRYRSDQGRARRAQPCRRAHDALRPVAARQPRASSPSTSCPISRGKIQVGLFNILQEGDVQIKGYPIRLKLDVMLVFTANPEDYTARGKIITPLKDRIGSEIRTHYPSTRSNAIAITTQEAWTERPGHVKVEIPPTCARSSRKWPSRRAPTARSTSGPASASACRSPRSSWSSRTPNGGRSRTTSRIVVPRVTDLYAALPSITGKFELEYEGELRGAEQVARDLIRLAVGNVFTGMFDGVDTRTVVEWFDLGGSLPLSDVSSADDVITQTRGVQGLRELTERTGRGSGRLGAGRCLGHRLRARRAVRAEEDQPKRGARLRRRRRTGPASFDAARRDADGRGDADSGHEEEVLQLAPTHT